MNEGTPERIETGSVVVDGVPVFYRRLHGEGPPVVLVHGVPTHSEDWSPVLERMSGPAIALDLPGFGRSARPDPEQFDGTMHSHAGLFQRFLAGMGVEEHSLVVHDWGAVALIGTQRRPERLRRLVIINSVPLLPGYRWHRVARIWRRRGLGELSMRLWTRAAVDQGLREARADWSRFDPAFVDLVWDHLDRGTLEAILRLYRSAPEEELERLGRHLGKVGAPTLVIWGLKDRYLPGRFGRAYAEALPNAELLELPEVGHWPWREQPGVTDRIVEFVES